MLALYLDNSGLNSGDFCFLAGYLSTTQKWERFESYWVDLCRQNFGKDYLVLDDSASAPMSNGLPISERALVQLAECITANVEVEIWSALPQDYARKIQEQYGYTYNPYWLCLSGVFSTVLSDVDLVRKDAPISWVLDHYDGPDSRDVEMSLFRSFQDARNSRESSLLHSVTFAGAKTLPPLQAANFLAWQKRNAHQLGAHYHLRPEYKILLESVSKKVANVWIDYKLEDLLRQQGYLPIAE